MATPTQTQVKSSLKTLVIQKDYRKGNFFAKKGTPLKGEVIIVPTLVPPSPSFLKVFMENAPKGEMLIGAVYGDILIPMEYFEEAPENPFKKDGSDFGITKLYFIVGVVGIFVIYKLIKGK